MAVMAPNLPNTEVTDAEDDVSFAAVIFFVTVPCTIGIHPETVVSVYVGRSEIFVCPHPLKG
jgi:hypothetical protein